MEELLRTGRSPDEVEQELKKFAATGDIAYAPTGRTIRNWISRGWVRRPPRPDDPWSLLTGHAEDLAFVVPVIPLFLVLPEHVRWLSLREAEAIARIRRVASELPHVAVATLATLYAARFEQRKPSKDLDLYLAVGPWRYRFETIEEQRRKFTRYRHLASGAGVEPLLVSLSSFGVALFGGAFAWAMLRADDLTWHTLPDRPTDELNEGALDFAAYLAAPDREKPQISD